ncbi:MAG: AMP-dependent synthetase and ligase [Firmicutes bacterium]|nr:AMP-dependent synthetase and ligase [Bacillota bacterium]
MRATVQQNKMFEAWNAKKMGFGSNLTRDQIAHYQLHKVRQTIQRAYGNSPFYRKLLKSFVSKEINCMAFYYCGSYQRTGTAVSLCIPK